MNKRYFIYLSFFLSGAAALMYEIIWARMFSLTFGSTTYSITAVLTAFMAGLAYGSLFLGRIADRIKRRLAFYGWIELLIGLYALIFPSLFQIFSNFYLELIGPDGTYTEDKLILKFLISIILMLVPTTLMGGSLPVLGRVLIRNLKVVPQKLGILYAVNTLGAVTGIYLVGFHLIGKIGVDASLLVAAVINIVIGLSMILFAGKSDEHVDDELDLKPEHIEYRPLADEKIIMIFAVTAFMMSGFVSLSYEVIWTRLLTLIIGSSTYAFSIILICFLLGITLGSFLIGHEGLIPRRRITITMFSLIQIGIGISAYILIPVFSRLPAIMLKAFNFNEGSYIFITFYQFVMTLIIMIIPTTLMGATLPVIGKIVSTKVRRIGSSIGNIYFFNSFGAIFGSFLTGFIFIEYLGTLKTLKLGITINVLLGVSGIILAAFMNRRIKGLVIPLVLACFCLAGVWISKWDIELMDAGVSIYGQEIAAKGDGDITKNGTKLLYFHEGVNATITVRKGENVLYMKTNGKADASTSPTDMTTQTLLGYLPMLLHPNPHKVMVIGMGSGVTASTVTQYDSIQELDIVEIEHSVFEAAEFFQDVNYSVAADPKTHIFINDGRNQLLESKRRYDLIISEPSNPWISGIGSLYTTEYFKIINKRLKRRGIFCQWIQAYSMSLDNLKMILRTMAISFEDLQLWTSGSGDFLLIGSNSRIKIDLEHFGKTVGFSDRTKKDFSQYLLVDHPVEILGRLMLDKGNILSFSEGARINSDNYPYLEFLAPKDLYLDARFNTLRKLYYWHEENEPGLILGIHKRNRNDAALIHYSQARLYKEINWLDEAKEHLKKTMKLDNMNENYHYLLGEIFLMEGNYQGAVSTVQKGFSIKKTSRGVEILSAIRLSTGQTKEALSLLEQNRELFKNYELRYGEALYTSGLYGQAIPYLLAALNKAEYNEYLLMEKIARSYQAVGDLSQAEKYYHQSIEKQEMNPWIHLSLAEVYFKQGKYREAKKHYEFLTAYWDDKRLQTDKAEYMLREVLPALVKG